MPIDIITIATLLGIAIATLVLLYTLTMFRDWVKTRIGNERNKQILAGAIKEPLENGDIKIISFLYNSQKQEVMDKEAVQAADIEDEFDEKFKDGVYLEIAQAN
jgi:hypothetical protein